MDTENKRRSVVGIYGLRTVPPSPDSAFSATDRRHLSSLYAMEPAAGRLGFWVPVELSDNSGWEQDTDSSQTWENDSDSSSSWTPVSKVDE